jgi:L-aminopeptidase/D-esterase-like protein
MQEATLGFGFKVGHWTNPEAATGCTVILPPRGNVAACEIRGSSPGSREIAQLDNDRRLTEIHGLLLTGGSAFGLAAAQGVVEWLEERGIGYETPIATIPIVPAAVVFDLGVGRSDVRPGPDGGRAACDAATEGPVAVGRVGAGTGASVGKWAGPEFAVPGGVGIAHAVADGAEVGAIAIVNAIGDVIAPDGSVLAGTSAPEPRFMMVTPQEKPPPNTVLVAVVTRSDLDKREVRWLASRAADGITVTIRPAHTRYDGDIAFAVAAPGGDQDPPPVDLLGVLATQAVATAVRNAVAS